MSAGKPAWSFRVSNNRLLFSIAYYTKIIHLIQWRGFLGWKAQGVSSGPRAQHNRR
jgi:hypothetical protein